MAQMGKTMDALRAADLRDKTKVIVGGAPLTEGYATICADDFAQDASRGAAQAKKIIGRQDEVPRVRWPAGATRPLRDADQMRARPTASQHQPIPPL